MLSLYRDFWIFVILFFNALTRLMNGIAMLYNIRGLRETCSSTIQGV